VNTKTRPLLPSEWNTFALHIPETQRATSVIIIQIKAQLKLPRILVIVAQNIALRSEEASI
jgi:hypothetical protein